MAAHARAQIVEEIKRMLAEEAIAPNVARKSPAAGQGLNEQSLSETTLERDRGTRRSVACDLASGFPDRDA